MLGEILMLGQTFLGTLLMCSYSFLTVAAHRSY